MDKQDLLDLKERIDEAKEEISKLEGRKAGYLETLKDQFKCSSVKEANELLQKMDKNIEDLDDEIKTGLEQLEEEFDFSEE
ncbi:MAG: hypothetical protein M0R31_03835 [Candidatus Riflebacteria bacterium]|nr:hypothetical protein [Candidatus Riflebacteria bacterium]